ncbi:maleylpyruvate isomerase family mycothiol-dependent enzyme [Sphaerisporangium perillae]|uniref:maleylpyruvate isomerase family mycothiol-dependent enzyme n=1 Tax=Sphaerisporangium perillae TaxID=2935860 RepID=UPI0020108142|nr:maleylpyruvate isomerase family mycothiol-dependent enzyme [Sphaerisporangium perillae]
MLSCLADDFSLLRGAVAAAGPDAKVPSCPEWTVADLARHVAEVYLHKAECIRLGAFPDDWPEAIPADPFTALDRYYDRLTSTFAAHSPADPAATWHDPDQTVGFWIRRMAQETVVHRVDAELAAGVPVSPIADDLAFDGVDEVLKLFLAYGSTRWKDDIGSLLDAPDQRPLSVATGHHAWTVLPTPSGVEVQDAATGFAGEALVSGEPAALLLWLWNRAGDDAVRLSGDQALLGQFRALRTAVTQ